MYNELNGEALFFNELTEQARRFRIFSKGVFNEKSDQPSKLYQANVAGNWGGLFNRQCVSFAFDR